MPDRTLELDPIPDDTLEGLWDRLPKVAEAIEDVLDWIERDPPDPRAKRRRFTNGMWAITTIVGYEEWLIIWDEPEPNLAVIRRIGESASL